MTTTLRQPLTFRTFATALAVRTAALLLAVLVFAAGWIFIANQQALLWARLPASTVERFVADHVATQLPRLPGAAGLQAACARPLTWKAQWRRAWLRAELADCFTAPDGLTTGATAERAVQHYEAVLAQQAEVADAWLAEFDAQASTHRARLQAELAALQAQPASALKHWLQAVADWLPAAPATVRENLGADTATGRAAQTLREQTRASRARVAALAHSAQGTQDAQTSGQRARELALMVTGLQLVTDYGVAPPTVHLATARNTLADAMEWQRRARGYQERGFSLADLQALPSTVLASSVLLLLVVAVTTRGSALAVGLWGMATLLLGMGALMLSDVALTGDPSLRYLAVRQFQSFGVGDWWVPLTLALPFAGLADAMGVAGHGVVTLWWPLVLTAAGLLVLRAVRHGAGWALAPVRAWVRWGADVRWGALQSALLLGAGTSVVLFLGMPAAISELLILLGCVGVASYLARQAPHANAGAGFQPYNLILVASALALAVGGAVAVSMVPKTQDAAAAAAAAPVLSCDELGNAVAAWNLRLSALQRPVRVASGEAHAPSLVTSALQLDVARLAAAQPMADLAACRTLARTLGQMLDTDLPRLVGRQSAEPAATAQPDAARLSVFDKPRAVGARHADYATANAWWGRPGCLLPADGLPDSCAQQSPNGPKGWTAETLGTDVVTDIWLQRSLAPQLYVAQRTPSGTATLNHHAVAVGPALGLTLVPALQQAAQRTADCATGRLHGADCEAVLPQDPAWRQRHFGTADALRSAAMGIVVAEVDSGRVVAMAGAVSDCTLSHLSQSAQPDAQGRMPALREGSRCAQLPDQRSAWLAQQAPALWMVPPGSALKPFSLVAGMDAGVMGAQRDDYWKGILAESHERLPIQRTALAAGQRYLDVLSGVGFGADKPVAGMELLWGGLTTPEGKPLLRAKWTAEAYAGTQTLRATSMPLAQAEQIRREKLAGVNVDKRYGEAVTTEFVAARKLADASVGGGDIRINALGLVDAWRALDLRARGHASATALHLLEQPNTAIPAKSLAWASPQAAARALGMTTGVTASAWKGTAQGSCRVVFGACAPQGLAGLSGKTGSSDFLLEEDSPFVKPGMQLPAKLFGGVFAAPDGKRYAVAVMALRVREGNKPTLELTSSAPAEAALTMMRSMGVR